MSNSDFKTISVIIDKPLLTECVTVIQRDDLPFSKKCPVACALIKILKTELDISAGYQYARITPKQDDLGNFAFSIDFPNFIIDWIKRFDEWAARNIGLEPIPEYKIKGLVDSCMEFTGCCEFNPILPISALKEEYYV